MGERRALLIGAQNDRHGELGFIPEVIKALQAVVLDPQYGACRPALSEGRELLTGSQASQAAIMTAVKDAIVAADRDQATLFVYFLGHGHKEGEDFYLVAADSPGPAELDSQNAVPLGQRVKELLRRYPSVDGLMLVIDACHSGAVIIDPVPGLLRQGLSTRVEFFAATRPDDTTAQGCFSRSVIELLTHGSPHTADAQLRVYDEHHRLSEVAPPGCQDLAPTVHLSLNGSRDAGLWLGRNRAADVRPALARTAAAGEVARLTQGWQARRGPAAQVLALLAAGVSPIAVTGKAGTGKSALLASFGRRSAGQDLGLDALASTRPGDTLAEVAARLEEQLSTHPGYAAAAAAFTSTTSVIDRQALPLFDQIVTGPLAHLDPDRPVLVGVDAVDQLDTVQRRRLLEAFTAQPGATVIVTGRQVDDVPTEATVHLPDHDPDGVARLLREQVQDPAARELIATLSGGQWLLARVLTGLHTAGHLTTQPEPTPTAVTGTTAAGALFETAVQAAISATPHAPVTDVLRVLAAAPVGAWMPLPVVIAVLASGPGDDPGLPVRVRDAIVALGELVARADPGTPTEYVGPAHDLIAGYLKHRLDQAALAATHTAIAHTLTDLMSTSATSSAIAVYAKARLSEHHWAAGHPDTALAALPELSTPADNLALWQAWHARLQPVFAGDHPVVLTTRGNIAAWTGRAGDVRAALDLFTMLLPDQVRVLGTDHPDVLTTRNNIAAFTGEAGDVRTALAAFIALLPDRVRALGAGHPDVLTTRSNIAGWTGRAGDAQAALTLFAELLPDLVRVLGADHPDVLTTRNNIAGRIGRAGDVRAALKLFTVLLPDQVRVLGADHPDVLTTRNNIAAFTGEAGDAQAALRLITRLLPDRVRVLGADHPDVLTTRSSIAIWTGRAGDAQAALRLITRLLPDQVRVLGADHPDVLTTRNNIASWTGQAGDAQAALKLFTALLPDLVRVLDADHPNVLTARGNVAGWTGRAGDAQAALNLFTELLPDQVRVLGADHPDVLTTRNNIARSTGQAGDIRGALNLSTALLPDLVRVLGAEHPDVLRTRKLIAYSTRALHGGK
jgi:hypothetical protein